MATVRGTNRSERIDGADGVTNERDEIFGFAGDDIIFGLGGNDQIHPGAGVDTIDGGAGMDQVWYLESAVGVTVNLAQQRGFGGDAEGDRYVSIELAVGSNHNDVLIGLAGRNFMLGAEGDDLMIGDDAADTLAGNEGNDTIKGGGGADIINGQAGDDVLNGGEGGDLFLAGTGLDTLAYDGSPERVWVSLLDNTASGGHADGDIWEFVDNLRGSAHDDILVGDNVANTLSGGDGRDHLKGAGGADRILGGDDNDQLLGQDGNDVLDGGRGVDRMLGDNGTDHYFVDDAADVVLDGIGQGTNDRVFASTSYALAAGQEIEQLTTANNFGLSAINLTGNNLANTIFGNAGSNALKGLTGNDTLVGLEGADAFVVNTALDAVNNVDRFADFTVVDDDIILSSGIFTEIPIGTLSAASFIIGSVAGDADDRIIYNNTTGAVFYDPDGTGADAQIQFAILGNGGDVTNADFIVV